MSTIYEIGVKLGHVLWRKLFPAEREQADINLNDLAYDLIDTGKYELAIRLLDFAYNEIKKFSNEANQLALVVNLAQAYKWKGDEERCKKIMRGIDWSAKGEQFKLAHDVLSEDWDRAAKTMKRIGIDGSVHQIEYRDWPLFRNFRKQEIFMQTYQEIFGEEFSNMSEVKVPEPPSTHELTIDADDLAEDDI